MSMSNEGKIAGTEEASFDPWAPDLQLNEPTMNEVRFSLGFLRAQPARWFPSFGADWLPLLHALGVEASIRHVRPGFEFPDSLVRVTPIEIDGEVAVLGLDDHAESILCRTIAPGVAALPNDLVLEYLERRFVATLERSWAGSESFPWHYISPDQTDTAEVVGVIEIGMRIDGDDLSLWIGFGPRAIERIDSMWRREVSNLAAASGSATSQGDDLYTVKIELAQLMVPPAELIDYLKPQTVIDLGLALSDQVTVHANDRQLAAGQLTVFNGRFAVKILDTDPIPVTQVESTTCVRVEVAETVLDRQTLHECLQHGAYLLTATPVGNIASLSISGESVAQAVMGSIDGRFALTVLPK
ncbi:MAG: FliM/FliN family flagellar motor switch protein [Bdellovibrionales bacterium]|nr:FliM/FliN family flagellar motor switch protein [Bdellovibrionales bacterium]